MSFVLMLVKPHSLELSAVKKKELFDFIKNAKNKEEYRRAIAVKQKTKGQSFRIIGRSLAVNYRNVYYMVRSYKEHGLGGIKSKRRNAVSKKPKISSEKNKYMIKEIISKSPRTFGYLKNTWSIRL